MFRHYINKESYLEIFQKPDAPQLFQLIQENRESIGEWLSFPAKTKSIEDSEAFIERSLKRMAEDDGYWAGIWHEGRLAGAIGYLYIDWNNRKTEIGYWLGKGFEGKGLATLATAKLIENAFKTLKLNKVEINIAVENVKSRAVAERLGLKQEAVIRDYELLHGRYLDRVVYGIVREEWILNIGKKRV